MQLKTWKLAAALSLALGLGGSWPVHAQEAVKGERLDPSTYGPELYEDMEAVADRDRLVRRDVNRRQHIGQHGEWVVPSRRATTAVHSGEHCVTNKWGDTRMGIGFPEPVDVRGVYVAGQSGRGAWTTGLRVIGYRDGEQVGATDWFSEIGEKPAWFEIDLSGVDRIEFECVPVLNGAGWYALDDLTYVRPGQPDQPVVVNFEDAEFGETLTGTGYAGLSWEIGTGEFLDETGVPAPMTPPGYVPPKMPPGGDAHAISGGTRATAPALVSSFNGVQKGDQVWTFPPDTMGAIGPDHYVEVVNEAFAIYDRDTGAELYNVALTSFQPGTSGDPRVLFDQHSGRWIVISTNFTNRLYIAVSAGSSPTGSWYKTSFVMSTGSDSGCDPDYPTLGVDENGIYVTAFMYGCNTMSIWAIDKAPLVSYPQSLGTVTAWRSFPWCGAIQPAHTYGSAPGEYLIEVEDSNELTIRRIDPPLTSPTLQYIGNVTVPAFYPPPLAPALGSNPDLDTVDDRLMMAVYRDGSLWTCHTISANNKAACRWYEINAASASLIQSGTVTDGTLHYYFPSIMVNVYGNVVMGFTGSHANQYAGCYYTGRLATDPPGEMATPVQYKAGTGAQNNIDYYGRNRWGDYSYTTLDPLDETTFWTIQEYGRSSTNSIWGTYVAQLSFGDGDCNGNGIPDLCDLDCGLPGCSAYPGCGQSEDCNSNNIPDECELADHDCNGNGVPDDCDVAGGTSADCNENGVPDECDIAEGTSQDCQPNGIPDECDLAPPSYVDPADDCADAQLVCTNTQYTGTTVGATNDGSASCGSSATSPDVWYYYNPAGNGYLTISLAGSSFNTVLSVHEGCPGTSANEVACNDDYAGNPYSQVSFLVLVGHEYWIRVAGHNGATGAFQMTLTGPNCTYEVGDCNDNGIPDECDIADCPPGTPECDDCNGNGVPDACDISSGYSEDADGNGIPDECGQGCGDQVLGDTNCDGTVNAFDIDPFILAVTDPAAWESAYGGSCDMLCVADCNQDGVVNAFDIDPFIALLTGK